ncbi:DUF6703 family protein [Labedaea rhizosphaerae]|uniref:Uncharacterized protein n=1 Tax=Labedaea rhizosphaerae TaxID=598644 RepID=A0A4R6S9U3_LABRH|nr:DUF6703 family protein [Labedaea rhizosphaerae]TDP96244.1 hypothetical protein EV186_104228 [Labedaea rhizosphaerae]
MPLPQRPSRKGQLLPGDGLLARVPPVAAFLIVVAVFAGGVLIGGAIGALVLGVLALALAGLLASTWGALHTSQRAGRVAVLLILVVIAITLAVR